MKEKDNDKRTEIENENDSEKDMKLIRSASVGLIVILLIAITLISLFSSVIEAAFGKIAGTITLVIIAAGLAIYLFRKEKEDDSSDNE